jgi:hypothetical protein
MRESVCLSVLQNSKNQSLLFSLYFFKFGFLVLDTTTNNQYQSINPINNQSTINNAFQFPAFPSILLIMFFTLSSVLASLKKFREEVSECAICLEPCTDTLVSPECNHRFCGKCIKESLRKCNHECPTCRAHIPTYRTCRRDPQFDHIVSTQAKTK